MAVLSSQEVQILVDQTKALSSMSGINGSMVYGVSVAAHTGSFCAISIRESGTTFTSLTAKGAGPDLALADFYKDSTTPLTGDLLTPPKGYAFTSFQLSAGSVQAH